MSLIPGNRGLCPLCQRPVAITADGKVARWHRDQTYIRDCGGFGLQSLPLPLPLPPAPELGAQRRTGTCPVCGWVDAPLTAMGRMWLHSPPDQTRFCTSVGRKPLEAES